MAKRLNDTSTIAGGASASGVEHTVRSRKIDNGYVVSTSTYNCETGEYWCSERFSAKPPKISAPGVSGMARDATGNSSLSDTKKYLGEDV